MLGRNHDKFPRELFFLQSKFSPKTPIWGKVYPQGHWQRPPSSNPGSSPGPGSPAPTPTTERTPTPSSPLPEPDGAEPQLRAQVTTSLVFCLHITGTTRQRHMYTNRHIHAETTGSYSTADTGVFWNKTDF